MVELKTRVDAAGVTYPMNYPAGMLLNTSTNRYHPIVFRYGPPPSGDLSDGVGRYKSSGHHTVGFDTLEEAENYIKSNPAFDRMPEANWGWDGTDIPAMVVWIKPREQDTPPRVVLG